MTQNEHAAVVTDDWLLPDPADWCLALPTAAANQQ